MAADMATSIRKVQTIIDYQFVDTLKLWEALQAAGSPVRIIGGRNVPDGQKRLAMIGDSVLKLALIGHWYNGNDARAVIQPVVSAVGSNANLEAVGRHNGLDQFVNTNPSSWGAVSSGTMAHTVEAILGAVYLDGGMNSVQQVMRTLGLGPV